MGFHPIWKQREKLSNAITAFLTGKISIGSTILPQLFLFMSYPHNFPQMKKTNNGLVWVISHVPSYTTKPLWIKAFQTSWSPLEVVHLLLKENDQKKNTI